MAIYSHFLIIITLFLYVVLKIARRQIWRLQVKMGGFPIKPINSPITSPIFTHSSWKHGEFGGDWWDGVCYMCVFTYKHTSIFAVLIAWLGPSPHCAIISMDVVWWPYIKKCGLQPLPNIKIIMLVNLKFAFFFICKLKLIGDQKDQLVFSMKMVLYHRYKTILICSHKFVV